MREILKATLASLALWAAAAPMAPAAAQARPPAGPAQNWGSVFVVGYTGIGAFNNPVGTDALNQNETWNLGSGIGLGVSAAHVLGQALQIGAEATFAPSIGAEITDPGVAGTTSGHAKVGTAFATGRLMTGGGGGLGFFLQGGVGAVYWGMPAPATTATDFAYRYGGGIEYQTSMRRAIFLQWGQIGAFHKHHGVSSNTVKFSQITGGIRIGL